MGFYDELAPWWPVISPVEEYAEEAGWIATLLPPPGSTVLELGSGGGHLSHHLIGRHVMTLTDVSPQMLEVSRELNPDCEHVCADMRRLRLGRVFDAVLAHDAIDYMVTRADLAAAAATAYAHCADGGTAVFVPDDLAERFAESTELLEHDAGDGRSVRLVEWTWDPDPGDEQVQTEWVFVLRSADGEVTVHHDTHIYGLFTTETWVRTLTDAGFTEVRAVAEPDGYRTAFVAQRG